MKDKPCKRHRAHPEFIGDCVGCDIESYNSDLSELKGDLAELKEKYRWRDVKEAEVNKDYIGRWWGNGREKCHLDDNGQWWYVDKMVGIKKSNIAPTHFMPMPRFEVKG